MENITVAAYENGTYMFPVQGHHRTLIIHQVKRTVREIFGQENLRITCTEYDYFVDPYGKTQLTLVDEKLGIQVCVDFLHRFNYDDRSTGTARIYTELPNEAPKGAKTIYVTRKAVPYAYFDGYEHSDNSHELELYNHKQLIWEDSYPRHDGGIQTDQVWKVW